jgi:Glycosidases
MLGTCLHMMKGTPYIFQGEEIGMTNVAFDNIKDYRDIETLNSYKELVEKKGKNKDEMMQAIHDRSRDNARTPMQWDDSENAGFTVGKPWIKVNPNYTSINAKAQIDDKDSIFSYYKKLISIRKEYPIVVYGKYDLILEESEDIYAYTRTLDKEKLLVICNFTEKENAFQTPSDINTKYQKLIISNYDVLNQDLTNIVLRPYEARVYLLQV